MEWLKKNKEFIIYIFVFNFNRINTDESFNRQLKLIIPWKNLEKLGNAVV